MSLFNFIYFPSYEFSAYVTLNAKNLSCTSFSIIYGLVSLPSPLANGLGIVPP